MASFTRSADRQILCIPATRRGRSNLGVHEGVMCSQPRRRRRTFNVVSGGLMPFNVYPDDATATLLGKRARAPITLESTEAMRSFVPLAAHVGPDPALGNVPT